MKTIDAMGEAFRGYLTNDPDRQEAFFYAFLETHQRLGRFVPYKDSESFYTDFRERCVKPAGEDVDDLVYVYLRIFSSWLSRHNYESVCLDPARLLLAATEPPPDDMRSIAYRKYFDSRRRLALALQYMAIELADPDSYSSEDLLCIDELSYERLFALEDDVEIWTVAELSPSRNNRLRTTPTVFDDHRKAQRYAEHLADRGRVVFEDHYLCRIVRDGDTEYIVWAHSRWKKKRATLLKLERGRDLTDRRGWKYVLVAIRQNGVLKTAKYGHAVVFAKISRERLWQSPLIHGADGSKINPNRHTEYRDIKLVGRFESEHGGQKFSAQVEQLILCVHDHQNTLASTDGVNHLLYRAHEIVKTLCPLWFPFDVFGIDWPKYPVDGEDRSSRKLIVKEKLENWWRSQIVY
ncbi:MAG: hypothetical protein ABH846_00925 [Patescibacteria group bacterium]